jgi:HEAT repeat protein
VALTLLEGSLPVRSALAENPGVCRHEEVVERILDKEDDGTVLSHLLNTCNPDLNCEQARRLHGHSSADVRRGIAKSKLPEECACDILRKLADDECWYVRSGVAGNTNIPEECACDIFEKLKDDKAWQARINVAGNTTIPEECACDILKKLVDDTDSDVREIAIYNYKKLCK